MVKPASGQPQNQPENLDTLLARREALLREIGQIDKALSEREALRTRRRSALQELKGSVRKCGDVLAPVDNTWEAEA